MLKFCCLLNDVTRSKGCTAAREFSTFFFITLLLAKSRNSKHYFLAKFQRFYYFFRPQIRKYQDQLSFECKITLDSNFSPALISTESHYVDTKFIPKHSSSKRSQFSFYAKYSNCSRSSPEVVIETARHRYVELERATWISLGCTPVRRSKLGIGISTDETIF